MYEDMKESALADPNRAEADPRAAHLIAIGDTAMAPGVPIVRARFEVLAINRRKGYVPKMDERGEPVLNLNDQFDMRMGVCATVELLHVHCDSGDGRRGRRPDPNHPHTRSWLAVPKGEIKIDVTDPRAVARLAIGREYVVEIRACDEARVPDAIEGLF